MRPLFLAEARPMKEEWKMRPYLGVLPLVLSALEGAAPAKQGGSGFRLYLSWLHQDGTTSISKRRHFAYSFVELRSQVPVQNLDLETISMTQCIHYLRPMKQPSPDVQT